MNESVSRVLPSIFISEEQNLLFLFIDLVSLQWENVNKGKKSKNYYANL